MADGQSSDGGYGWGQSSSGFLGGFLDATNEVRQRNDRQNELNAQIEQRALEHLATADDPTIKAAAVTAMLTPRKSGPGVFAKWFSQQQGHPIFDQVQQLVGGKSPWLSIEEKERQQYQGAIRGRVGGALGAYTEYTGEQPSPEFAERVIGGATGAASRTPQLQYGTFIIEDPATGKRTSVAGYADVDPHSGQQRARDFNNQPIQGQIVDFRHSGLNPQAAKVQGKWIPGKMADGTPGYVFQDITGKIWATPPPPEFMSEDVPPPPGPIIIQTGEGAKTINPRTPNAPAGPVIPGTENTLAIQSAQRQRAQSQLTALRNLRTEVEKAAQGATFHIPGIVPLDPSNATGEYAVNLDKATTAHTNGQFTTYKDLLAAEAAANQAVITPEPQADQGQGQALAPPPPPIDLQAPARTGTPAQRTKPRETGPTTATPATRPPAKRGAMPTLPQKDDKLDEMLRLLQRQ